MRRKKWKKPRLRKRSVPDFSIYEQGYSWEPSAESANNLPVSPVETQPYVESNITLVNNSSHCVQCIYNQNNSTKIGRIRDFVSEDMKTTKNLHYPRSNNSIIEQKDALAAFHTSERYLDELIELLESSSLTSTLNEARKFTAMYDVNGISRSMGFNSPSTEDLRGSETRSRRKRTTDSFFSLIGLFRRQFGFGADKKKTNRPFWRLKMYYNNRRRRRRGPVLIHHGLFASSANFVLSDAEDGALGWFGFLQQ